MPAARFDVFMIFAGLIAWAAIFALSWHGKLGVSGLVSDSLLALLAAVIAYRLWRLYRRPGRTRP